MAEAPPWRQRLRDAARRSTVMWAPILVFAGMYLTIYVTESDDPCCHVQTPGMTLSATGAISFYLFLKRRHSFRELMGEGSSVHRFRDVEDELDELSCKLPSNYRAEFLDARRAYRKAR